MLSILSAKREARRPMFRFGLCFSLACWLGILASHIVTAFLAIIINKTWLSLTRFNLKTFPNIKYDFNKFKSKYEMIRPLMTHLRILLNQPVRMPLEKLVGSAWIVHFCWQAAALLFIWSFSSKLLEFTVFPTPYLKINSLDDVVMFLDNGYIKSVDTFTDETFDNFVKEDNDLARKLRPFTTLHVFNEGIVL